MHRRRLYSALPPRSSETGRVRRRIRCRDTLRHMHASLARQQSAMLCHCSTNHIIMCTLANGDGYSGGQIDRSQRHRLKNTNGPSDLLRRGRLLIERPICATLGQERSAAECRCDRGLHWREGSHGSGRDKHEQRDADHMAHGRVANKAVHSHQAVQSKSWRRRQEVGGVALMLLQVADNRRGVLPHERACESLAHHLLTCSCGAHGVRNNQHVQIHAVHCVQCCSNDAGVSPAAGEHKRVHPERPQFLSENALAILVKV
mmetsp:Transcript_10783/g.27778  ORF Transcript_10783/g.27778 Transcript_10783/m.27778 type:complete len:260 (-) Transcript_10783:544-1323(-)